jgi:hypothetical protein
MVCAPVVLVSSLWMISAPARIGNGTIVAIETFVCDVDGLNVVLV